MEAIGMAWEFNDDNIDEIWSCLADMQLEGIIGDIEKDAGAARHEVLLVMLFEIERLAHEHGLPGPEFLMAAANNRHKFRGEVRASQEVREALDRIVGNQKQKGD